LHALLFLLALATTTLVGAEYYYAFVSDFSRTQPARDVPLLLARGLWYAGTIIGILGAHEMGHYLACRRYNVSASLPYFIPLYIPIPAVLQFGTLGAVIRIRQAFPSKKVIRMQWRTLAGFVVCAAALGHHSRRSFNPPRLG
jgi:membrane-associated protease RseP (regulator of RpoE activity)